MSRYTHPGANWIWLSCAKWLLGIRVPRAPHPQPALDIFQLPTFARPVGWLTVVLICTSLISYQACLASSQVPVRVLGFPGHLLTLLAHFSIRLAVSFSCWLAAVPVTLLKVNFSLILDIVNTCSHSVISSICPIVSSLKEIFILILSNAYAL